MEQILEVLRATYPNGHPYFIPLCLEEMSLHSKKNADYTQAGDPLGNFKRVAAVLTECGMDTTPAQVAFVYMLKQVDAVGRMLCKGYEGAVENIHSRLQDIAVYAKLIDILHYRGLLRQYESHEVRGD